MHSIYIARASDFESSIDRSHRPNLCLNLNHIIFALLFGLKGIQLIHIETAPQYKGQY